MMTTANMLRWAANGMILATLAGIAACDLTVTNPGPVQDDFLNDEGAFPAVLQGARRMHALGYTRIALDGAMVSLEAIPGGLFDTEFKKGILTSDNSNDNWENMQEARWVAEDGARRLAEVGANSGALYAELLVQAGYANRSLGHNMCSAVIDGGPAQDFMTYFDRAEQHFTDALAVASAAGEADLANAALAGRADVYMWQGNWSAAVADAMAVPNDFAFQLHYYDLDFPDSNEMMFRQASLPWREYTIWNTFMEGYYEDTGDPRMAWRDNPADPITMVDNLPFLVQLKFTEFTSPHTLASGWEMRLVEAEDILVNRPGDFQEAVDLINQVRTRNISDLDGNPLPELTAADATEAWSLLKQERRIELWGENRRLGDLRRWMIANRPGSQPMEDVSGRSSCFPIGIGEVRTNTNGLPTDGAPSFP